MKRKRSTDYSAKRAARFWGIPLHVYIRQKRCKHLRPKRDAIDRAFRIYYENLIKPNEDYVAKMYELCPMVTLRPKGPMLPQR